MTAGLQPAFTALDDADAALAKLEKTCCLPERSPRMADLAATIDRARRALGELTSEGSSDALTGHLEDAGSQVGRLQVGCCAENRLPLYARILSDLTTVQLTVDRSRGLGH